MFQISGAYTARFRFVSESLHDRSFSTEDFEIYSQDYGVQLVRKEDKAIEIFPWHTIETLDFIPFKAVEK